MQLIEDACGSFNEDEGDNETSSTASLANAAAATAAATVDGTMSSKRQLQFMQLWGERRQLLPTTTMQPRQQQQELKQKQQNMPAIAEENKNQTRTIPRTFVPSSAWRGLPGTNEVPANWSAKSGEVKMPNDKNDDYDEDENDEVDDGAVASSSEEEEINEEKKEAECLARTDQIISDESAVSVQSLCEAAAAASTDRTNTTAQREPSDIAAMLQNIRLGRRELYAEDSYAVRLERDLRAELRTELDRQQRLDARLDSLSLGDANEAMTTTVNENAQQGGGSLAVVFASEEKQQQNQPSQDSVSNGVSGVASSLAMRIKRRIGGGGVSVGARDSGEPTPAPPTHEPENVRLDRVAKKSLQASAAARKRKKAAATALMLSRRRRDINSSSSSNSPSDSSSSESDPQVNNRCRWRKPRVSSSNISNSNCSNAVHSESGSSRSSQSDIGHFDDNEMTADESNSSLPLKRPVYRAQGQGSPTKRPESTALPTVSSRGTKLNVSEFEADPNQSVHLDRVYQSVEQLEPSGAVRIIDPRQMLADLDEGWPTDQLKSAPLKCEVSSDSVAFKPKMYFTTTSGLRKSTENGGSPPTHATSSQATHSPQPNNRQLHRQTQRQSHHQQNQEQSKQRENRSEEFAKPHNTGNSADPAKFGSGNRRKQDERGRMRSQLLQLPGHQSTNTKVSGFFGQDVELSKVFNDSELPVDEVAKRIVVHRRNHSEQSGTDPSNRPEVRSPVFSQQGTDDDNIEEFRRQSVDSDEVDWQPQRFTSRHHGRISINNYKGMTKLVTLSRPTTTTASSLPNSTRNSAQIHHEHQKDAEHPPNGPGNNRNSSNRVRRLKNQQHRLKVSELMLAMQSTEPYFMSECREPVSGGNTGAAPVPRRCRQAVQVQSQPVHWDLQLRQVVVNPRALPHWRSQQKSFLTANEQKQCGDESSYLSKNNSSNSSSSSGVSNWGDDEWICSKLGPRCTTGLDRLDTFASILQQQKESQAPNKTQPRRKQYDKHQEQPSTIPHWIRLGSLPQPQKPNVAHVRLVLNNDIDCGNCSRRYRPTGSRYRTKKRIINSNSLNRNVSHCAETVDNPSLIPVSDSEQQMSQSRLTTQPTSLDLDGNNTASTVTVNSISCDCLSTFDAATVSSQSMFDFKLEPKLLRQASPVQLPPVLEACDLPYPTYLYCTCAIVETSSNGPHCQSLVKQNCHPKIGFSHLVYYMPNVTIFRGNVFSGLQYLQQQKKRRAKSVRRDYSGALCKTADSLTLLVACELIVPTKT